MKILGLLILLLDIVAIINIVGSRSSPMAKVVWSLAIVFLPVIGLVAWYFAGPRGQTVIA